MITASSLLTDLERPAKDPLPEIFKGLFYELSPLVITLALLVIVQNLAVAWDNYKRREQMAPWLFTGIAIGDIFFAQGLFILSLISIFVYRGVLDVGVLYKAQFYFVVTALPGLTCSKLYNVILSVILAVNLGDPFRVLNVTVIKRCIAAATGLLALLHLSDAILCLVADNLYHFDMLKLYENLAIYDEIPGGITLASLYCLPRNGTSRCVGHPKLGPTAITLIAMLLLLTYAVPVLTVLACMVLQIRSLLSRTTFDTQDSTYRRAAVTIFLVSTLFFTCHVAYLSVLILWLLLVGFYNQDKGRVPSFVSQGEYVASAQFVLPLINSFLYPLILILRKQELRERYLGYLRTVLPSWTTAGDTAPLVQNLDPPLEEPLVQNPEPPLERQIDQSSPLRNPLSDAFTNPLSNTLCIEHLE